MATTRFRRPASPVGTILRRLRASRGLSQVELAAAAGVSVRHLGFVEVGRSNPSRELVAALADALHAPLPDRDALLTAAGYAPASLGWDRSAWYRCVVDDHPLGLIAIDTTYTITLANRALADILGLRRPDRLIGKDLRASPIWGVSEARDCIDFTLARGMDTSFQVEGPLFRSGLRRALVNLSPARDGTRQLIGVSGVVEQLPSTPAISREVQVLRMPAVRLASW